GDQGGAGKIVGEPQARKMLLRLLIERLVDAALDAAGAVPRRMAVAKQGEACGNQRLGSVIRVTSTAAGVALAAPCRWSAAICARALRPIASLVSGLERSASTALANAEGSWGGTGMPPSRTTSRTPVRSSATTGQPCACASR